MQYTIEYRKTSARGNADALSRLPVGHDEQFDDEDDINIVSAIKTISSQIKPTDSETVRKESGKDLGISADMRYTREGRPEKQSSVQEAEDFRKIADSLSVEHGCLLYGARVVILQS